MASTTSDNWNAFAEMDEVAIAEGIREYMVEARDRFDYERGDRLRVVLAPSKIEIVDRDGKPYGAESERG